MIEEYSFGRMKINGRVYTNDVIVFPDRVRPEWWREKGHYLQMNDLEGVFSSNPTILIVGNGHDGVMKVDQKVKDYCRKNNIELIIMKTGDAVEKYNKMNKEGVVGAFHLTC